jgi:hypothetical protein
MAAINEPLDPNGNVEVNLPLNPLQAGYAQIAFNRGGGAASRVLRVTNEGEARIAHTTRLFDCDFNGAAAGALVNNQFNLNATTMAALLNGGFLRFNNGAVTTASIGAGIVSWRTFILRDMMSLKLSGIIRHSNAATANKRAEFGFGYYDVAAGQSAEVNEFAGFRWTDTGGLIGVLAYSTGGAPVQSVIDINGGVPFTDNVARAYEIVLDESGVSFWVDGVFQAAIAMQPDASGAFKSASYPIMFRQFHTASTPALAPIFDLGSTAVSAIGPSGDEDRNVLQVAMGRAVGRAQAGVQAASGVTGNFPASGTAPTATVGSNAATALTGLGGYGRCTLTGVVATVHTEIMLAAFQNPVLPEAAGAPANARPAVITDLFLSPLMVSVVLAGGGFTAEWFVAYGSTALSLATADANGGAAIGTKSPTRIPLPILETLAAAAAAGTIATRVGEAGHLPLQTPIVLMPGEFIQFGLRTLFVAAPVSAGAVDYGIGVHGYWI